MTSRSIAARGDVSLLPAGPGTGRPWYNSDNNNFAPAVGFAWTPTSDNKTSIRGGYRIAYNRLVNWALNVVEQNQPGTTRTSILRPNSSASATNTATVRASDAAVQTLVGQLATGIVGQPVQRMVPQDRSSTPLLFDPNIRTPFVNQWNVSIQREILKDTVLEVAYVGNKGTHMFRMMNANQATITPEFISSFKAAQGGVRTGTVGKLLDTFGATLPSNITTALANNDMSTFITAGGYQQLQRCGGRTPGRRRAGPGLLPQSAVHHRGAGLQLHRYQLQRAPGFLKPPLLQRPPVPEQLHLGQEPGRHLRRHRWRRPGPPDPARFQQPAPRPRPLEFRYPARNHCMRRHSCWTTTATTCGANRSRSSSGSVSAAGTISRGPFDVVGDRLHQRVTCCTTSSRALPE